MKLRAEEIAELFPLEIIELVLELKEMEENQNANKR